MIAETNDAYYPPEIIILDGAKDFIDGGPARGERVQAEVVIAGYDPIAVDAIGLAMLKLLGSNKKIMETKIFDHEQIQRAAELGLGVKSLREIKLVGPDRSSRELIRQLEKILAQEV